jgi:TolB-like protein
LNKDTRRRYATADGVRAALEGVETAVTTQLPLSAAPSSAEPVSSSLMTLTLSRRRVVGLGVGALVVAASGVAGWRFVSSGASVRTLAVLPLANPAGDEDLEYLCEGIAESLIQQVSKLRSFQVKPLRVVLEYKGPSGDPQTAGRRLGVETVLAGTLERQVEKLRISARLIDVASGRQLWSNTYERDADTLLELQDEISSAMMNDGLRVRLTSDERELLVRRPTTNAEAYDLYLQARYNQRLATEDDYLFSRSLLERAIQLDQNFALAYASLSGIHGMMVVDDLIRPADAWSLVGRYMRRAREIDPTLPELLIIEHAQAFLFDWDWAGAERARQQFLAAPIGEFDPQFARALAIELWALGQTKEALQLARRTRELDPGSPYLAVLEADYLLHDDQFDAAIALYEYAIKLDRENSNAFFGLAEAKMRKGRFDEAIQARRQAHLADGDDRLEPLFAAAKGEAGYRLVNEAWVRLQLEDIKDREKTSAYVSPLDFARAYAQLGDREQAFKYLDEAFVQRSPGLVFLKVDRVWDRIRRDPRFEAAIRKVGLP